MSADPATPGTYSGLPELLARPFAEQEPTPVFARRGQALVFTYGMLHQGWQNDDDVSRKAYIMTWMPAGVPGFLERSRIEGMREYHKGFRDALERWRPDRAHIFSPEFIHGVSEYGHKEGGEYWPEMFLPLPPRTAAAAAAAAAHGKAKL